MQNGNSKFKILMPVVHYHPVIGGLETWTQNIAERLSDRTETFVITGKVIGQPVFEIKNGVKIFRTSLFSLKNLSYSSSLYILTALPFIFLKSFHLVKKERINILHCQGFLSGFLGYSLSKLTKIPYIVTVQKLEEGKWFLKELIYKNAKICIAASSTIKKYFEEIGCKNIEIIPNGIDLERFKNLDRQKIRGKLNLKDEFVIMTVARLEKVKGIEYLIRAIDLLKENYNLKHKTYNLLIIGDGSERRNLESLVEKLKLKEKVKILGEVSNEEIPEYLVAADCFVLPSLKEGFGIAILEAQACCVPVIGTRMGGILDIIEDEKTGILVEPANPEVLAEAISKIYSDPHFAKNLAENAKTNLVKYDWQDISDKVYKIYQRTHENKP